MAAVITAPFGSPHQPGESAPTGPQLVVLEGGRRTTRHGAEIYRRRRWFATLVTTVVLASAWLAVSIVVDVASISGNPAAGGVSTPPVAGAEFVAQPGDTLWDVAVGLGIEGDVRDVVDRLVEFNGTSSLSVGQVVRIPEDLLGS
ncbi:MAG TPA: LysM peptidoglycan-binding domain-containing protein [Microthrixaceae bacterium]|nr:LysM peptidoglycan-binding domain-containing protein [Microthrixaceae bacterium]